LAHVGDRVAVPSDGNLEPKPMFYALIEAMK